MDLEVMPFHDEITSMGAEGIYIICNESKVCIESLSVDFEVTLVTTYDEQAFVPRASAVSKRASGSFKTTGDMAKILHEEVARGGSAELVIDPKGINEMTPLRRIAGLCFSDADTENGIFRFDSWMIDLCDKGSIFG
jgi:hypothetical protein